HQRGRTEAAGAHTEHLGVLEPFLPGHRDVRDDQMATVAAYLIDRERLGRFHKRRQTHHVRVTEHVCPAFRLPRTSPCDGAQSPPMVYSLFAGVSGCSAPGAPFTPGGYGHGFAPHRAPVTADLRPIVCCIITGARPPGRHWWACSWPSAWPSSWLIM